MQYLIYKTTKYSIQLDLLISMPVRTVTNRLTKQLEVIFPDEKRRDGAFQTQGSLLLVHSIKILTNKMLPRPNFFKTYIAWSE